MPSPANIVSQPDLYVVLGLDKSATAKEIRMRYKKFALKYHPEKEKNEDSLKLFHLISEAYDVLSDQQKKAVYDLYGYNGLVKGLDVKGLSSTNQRLIVSDGQGFEGNYSFPPEKALKLFKDFFGTDNVYDAALTSVPSADVKLSDGHKVKEIFVPPTIKLPLEDFYNGAIHDVYYPKRVYNSDGSISKFEDKKFKLTMKPGWKNGTKVIFPKEGHLLPNGFREDATFIVEQAPHEEYERVGDDLHVEKTITLREALTTTHLTIKTLDERCLSILISDVISPSYVKIIENEGMPKSKEGGGKGNMHIHFNIEFPAYLDQNQKKLIGEALKK